MSTFNTDATHIQPTYFGNGESDRMLSSQEDSVALKYTYTSIPKITPLGNFDDSPLFLRKTYFMINTSNKDIAHWSDDGNSFKIKDPDAFSSRLHQFFKHKNLHSFIRQLNFYGFRKIKELKPKSKQHKQKDKTIGFRHRNFVRDRPDLLVQIHAPRRNVTSTSCDVQKIEELKVEVNDMKDFIKTAKKQIGTLKTLAYNLVKKLENAEQKESPSSSYEISLSQNIPTRLQPCTEVYDANTSILNVTDLSPKNPAQNIDYNQVMSIETNTDTFDKNNFGLEQIWPDDILEYIDSFCSIENEDVHFDENTSDDIWDINNSNTLRLDASLISNNFEINYIDQELARKFDEAVKMFPKDMRHLFVKEQIFSKITNYTCLKKQVDAIFALATDVTKQTQQKQKSEDIFSVRHISFAPKAA